MHAIATRERTGKVEEVLDKMAPGVSSMGRENHNALLDYLGVLNTQVQPSAFEGLSHSIYDIPEAFKGKVNEYRTLITGFIFWKNDFLTSEILPWSRIKGMEIKWNIWQFDAPPLGKTPNRGVSRLISSSKAGFGETITRRGLGFHMESDYLETEEGKMNLLLNIRSLAQSVQETQNYDCLRALNACKNFAQIWQQIFGKTDYSIQEIMSYEADHFAALSHDSFAMDNMVENLRKIFASKGVNPDSLIVPYGMQQYLAMHDKTSPFVRNDVSGGKGLADHTAGDSAYQTFRDLKVYEAREYTGFINEPPMQMLNSVYIIGERYEMVLRNCEKPKKYRTCARDIYISDFDKNDMAKVKFEEAFMRTHVFDENGNFTSHVKKLIDSYNKGANGRTYSDDDPKDINWNEQSKRNTETAFVFACKNSKGQWTTPTHFGKMGYHAIGLHDLTFMAETLLNRLDKCDPNCSNIVIWNEMLSLIKKIENEPYHHDYFRQLYITNMGFPTDNTYGTYTPQIGQTDRAQVGNLIIREAYRNKFGSFDLNPPWRPNNVYPIGFANGPGFQYLASIKDAPGNLYRDVCEIAHRSVNLLDQLIKLLNTTFPTSEVINPENRDPWFHEKDPIATFFSLVVSTRRDPIFMPRLEVSPTTQQPDPEETVKTLTFAELIGLLGWTFQLFTNVQTPGAYTANIRGILCKVTNPIFILSQHLGDISGAALMELALADAATANSNGFVYMNHFARFILNSAENMPENASQQLWDKIRRVLITYSLRHANGETWPSLVTDFQLFVDAKKNKQAINAFLQKALEGTSTADPDLSPNKMDALNLILRYMEQSTNANALQVRAGNKPICWYRTPLTMSLRLLESLTRVQTPLCQPGDYTGGNVYPFKVVQGTVIAQHYIERSAYRDIERPAMFKDLRYHQLATRMAYPVPLSLTSKKRKGASQGGPKLKRRKQSLFFAESSSSEDETDDPQYHSYNLELQAIRDEQSERQPLSTPLNYPLIAQNPNAPYQEASMDVLDFNTDTLSRRWLDALLIQDPLVRAVYIAILFSQSDKREHWLLLLSNNVHLPLNIMLFRLNIRFEMADAIMLERGYNTGISAYNWPDFQFARNASTKELLGHYTIWTKSIVFNEQNVMFLRAIKPVRYLGGYNTRWADTKDDFLSDENDRASLIACITSCQETNYPKFLSFTGSFPPINESSRNPYEKNHWSSAGFYGIVYGVNTNYFMNKSMQTPADKDNNSPNYVAAQGLQFNWNFNDKIYNVKVDSQSHLREKGSAPGAVRVWNGHEKMFSDYDFKARKFV